MGGVSLAIAKAFKQAGGDIYCETAVNEITVSNGSVQGVKLESGKLIGATNVLANPTPQITFEKLIKPGNLKSSKNNRTFKPVGAVVPFYGVSILCCND